MADIAAHFEQPGHRTAEYLTTGLRHLATLLGGLRDKIELADTRLDLDARRLADAGIAAPRGFERTVASMLRCGLR